MLAIIQSSAYVTGVLGSSHLRSFDWLRVASAAPTWPPLSSHQRLTSPLEPLPRVCAQPIVSLSTRLLEVHR